MPGASRAVASGDSQLCSRSLRTPVYDVLAAAGYRRKGSRCLRCSQLHNRRVAHTLGRTCHHVDLQGPRVGRGFLGPRHGLFPTGRPALPFLDRVPRALSPGPGFRTVAVPARSPGLSEVGAPRPCRRTSQNRPHTAMQLSLVSHHHLGRTAAVDSTGYEASGAADAAAPSSAGGATLASPDPPIRAEGDDWCHFTDPTFSFRFHGMGVMTGDSDLGQVPSPPLLQFSSW